MIPKECKRLLEIDFPIAEVSRHASRDKSIRHGHPSTLHLWWARRPLGSSRAVLLALLWPDPCDSLCPAEFKETARKLLPQAPACNPGTTDQDLRQALLKFIADFANWGLASNQTYLDVSRALVKAAHGEESPLVVDPFAGGGSIPLEALRADNPAHRRIMAQPLGVVHILVSRKSSEHRLSQHSDESMPAVPASACVGEYIAGHRSEAERIVEFPVREQAGVGSDHRSAKLEH